MAKQFCVNCAAWSLTDTTCRKKCPICPPVISEIQTGRFPETDATCWCGEWVQAAAEDIAVRKAALTEAQKINKK
jgi:hypothetical protein